MALFDETEVEAGHLRLAFLVSRELAACFVCADLIRKVLLAHVELEGQQPDDRADRLAAETLGYRVVNAAGAVSKLIDAGYFVQAASLFRDIAETGMLFLYFAEKPTELRNWRLSEGRERYRRFGRSKLKDLVQDQAKFSDLDSLFDTYSEFGTHPSAVSIIGHSDGSNLYIGPHINPDLYVKFYQQLADLLWHVTYMGRLAYGAVFKEGPNGLFNEEIERFEKAREVLREAFDK